MRIIVDSGCQLILCRNRNFAAKRDIAASAASPDQIVPARQCPGPPQLRMIGIDGVEKMHDGGFESAYRTCSLMTCLQRTAQHQPRKTGKANAYLPAATSTPWNVGPLSIPSRCNVADVSSM